MMSGHPLTADILIGHFLSTLSANKRDHAVSRQATNGVANWFTRVRKGCTNKFVAGRQRCRQTFHPRAPIYQRPGHL